MPDQRKRSYQKTASRKSEAMIRVGIAWWAHIHTHERRLRTEPEYLEKIVKRKTCTFRVGDFEFECLGRAFEKGILYYCQLKRPEFEVGVPREIKIQSSWDGFERDFICELLENQRFKITLVPKPEKVREYKPDGRRRNPGAPRSRALPRVTFQSPKWQYTLCLMVTAHIPDYSRWRTKSGDPLPGMEVLH